MFLFLTKKLSDFDLKNMISTYARDFSRKIWPKTPEFYDKFQQVAKNIEGFWFFCYFHI